MASLSPPFILCPLPDRKALLGIRPDRLQNKTVITLGKNIAIRYHILEQKQESSWTTSRYWFTSSVIYCYDLGKYGAVLNHNIIALWDEGDSTLSNFEKLKLQEQIFNIESRHDGRSVVIMKNGNVAYISDLTEDKRFLKKGLLDPEEVIIRADVDDKNDQCFLITRKKNQQGPPKELSVVTVGIGKETGIIGRCNFGNANTDIMGYCICLSETDAHAIHFGGDGCIYKSKITNEVDKMETMKLANLSKSISDKSAIIMSPLNDYSSIAMYGCDASEEGAVVLIFDVQYDLIVSKQPLKMYSSPPFMEKVGQSLFVPHGLHILVLNFRITKSLLSTMVGKHQAKMDEEVFEGRNPWKTKGWESDFHKSVECLNDKSSGDISQTKEFKTLKDTYPTIWETIQQVKIFESEGQPEAVICNHVIPTALEKRNGEALDWILNTFLDIPEVHIVSMVVFSLQNVDPEENNANRLNSLLLRKFDKHLLTQSLRYVAYDDIKKLLLYITGLINNHWELDFESEEESPLKSWLKWCSCLVDAHYTKFVLHSDTKVIESLLESMNECTKVMTDVAEMEPFLVMTYTKNSFEPAKDVTKRWRTETVTFE